jgi:hypothetical protein
MSIKTEQLAQFIIKPVLKDYGLYSDSAYLLILGTCAQETLMGTYVHQVNGPALGIYQMEKVTHDDIYHNFILFRPFLSDKIIKEYGLFNDKSSDRLVADLRYATLLCRLHYLRVAEKLPPSTDITALAKYWKKYYNTEQGKGTVEEFKENYKRFILN